VSQPFDLILESGVLFFRGPDFQLCVLYSLYSVMLRFVLEDLFFFLYRDTDGATPLSLKWIFMFWNCMLWFWLWDLTPFPRKEGKSQVESILL
jgi:hypothetical protein